MRVMHRDAGPLEIGNGVAYAERRELGEFSAVASSGAIDVDVTIGSPPSVVVRGDENLVGLVRTRVKNGTLVIDTERSHSTRVGLHVEVTTPRLHAVAVAGSGSIVAHGLDTARLDVAIAGSGDIAVAGRADRLDIDLSGSGDADALGLAAVDVDVDIAGSGDAKVSASKKLDVTIAGSGSVRYAGNPTTRSSIAGSGDLAKLALEVRAAR